MAKSYLTFASSGRRYYYTEPEKEPPLLSDILYGLGGLIRGCGQWRPYTVLHHSWVCYQYACLKTAFIQNSEAFCLKVLLHDMTEAVMQDIPSNLKKLLPEYRALYDSHDEYLHAHFKVARPKNIPGGPQEENLLKEIDSLVGDVEGDFFCKEWTCSYPPDTNQLQSERSLIRHEIKRVLQYDLNTLAKLVEFEYNTILKKDKDLGTRTATK
jgi:hypothetical protein